MTDKSPGLAERVLKAGAWSYANQFTQQVGRFAVFAILARVLGPESYGLVSIALIAVSLSDIVVGPMVTDAIVHRRDLEDGHVEAVFSLQMGAGLVLAAAVWALSGPIAAAFHEPDVAKFLPWLGLAIVLAAASSAQVALLQRELKYNLLAIRGMVGLVVSSGVALWMAFAGYGPWALVAQQIALRATDVVVLYATSAWRPRLAARMRHLRDVLAMSLRMTGMTAIDLAGVNLPRIILGLGIGPAAVSFWNVGWRLQETLGIVFIQPLTNVWFPLVANVQGEPEKLREAVRMGLVASAFIAVPAFAGLAAVAPTLVPTLFGVEWAPGVPVVQFLCLFGVMWSLQSMGVPLMRGAGRQDIALRQAIVIVGLRAALLIGYGRFGPVEAGIAYFAPSLVGYVWNLALFRRLAGLGLVDVLRVTMPAVTASAAMFAAVTLALVWCERQHVPGLVTLAATVPLGVAVYAALVRVLAPELLAELIARGRTMLAARRAKAASPLDEGA